jgi:hypothetical protein
MKNFSILVFLFVFITIPIYSQITIHVPGDYPTIQAGINAANNGDIVLVADGLYYENINFNGKAITVASNFLNDGNESHIENTIIDGSQPSHPDTGSVVLFISGEDTNSVLCGFTITGGSGTYYSLENYRLGGGIILFGSGAKICHNIITSNTIDNSTIYTRCHGGGIFAALSTSLIIANNVISNNTLENYSVLGGGISLYSSGLTWIISNKIINNVINGTGGSGGGIDIFGTNSELYIKNNIIKGNQALTNNYGGGGIDVYESYSPVFISNNLIAENKGYQGGGVLVENYVDEDSRKMKSINFKNHNPGESKIFDNPTSFSNELIFEATIESNTIVNNNATTYCGGIFCLNASPEIRNSIIWGNQAPAGPQIEGAGFVEYSDVEGGYPGTGNIDIDPEFADSTYYLLTENVSLCIDAGDPDPMYNDVEDPNNPGFALYPAMGTLRNDMGAFGGPNSTWASVLSDTLYVPGDYSTIQTAIDATVNGNVVLVADGTYFENINFKGKAITVASHFLIDGNESHIENTIIDGSQPSNPDSGSVVSFISGEDTTSVLSGFTITGGTGTYYAQYDDISGGGINIFQSGAKICNNIIENNSVDYNNYTHGAGILADVYSNSLIIENNIIRNNSANATVGTNGGGIGMWNTGYARIVNNKILDNTVTCSVRAWGAGIHCNGVSREVYILNNIISSNECTTNAHGGGGIAIYNGTPTIKNNLIAHNSTLKGGGVLVESGSYSLSSSGIEIQGKSLQNNRSKNPGKANSKLTQSETLLENNTIVDNTVILYGGGIFISAGIPEIMNCIIWGNTQLSGPQISGTADVQYSDVEGGYAGTGNMNEDPNFDDTTYFCLNQDSHCIDAGNPDPIYYDVEDPQRPGFALLPARGSLTNDMGHFGGPSSLWSTWDIPVSVERDETENGLPDAFTLSQNYPNPFNPTTTIVYGLRERTNVLLKLFDVLGSEIEIFVSGEQDAGYYEIEFNASRLASGIYFYRLQAGSFVETKKMMLLK